MKIHFLVPEDKKVKQGFSSLKKSKTMTENFQLFGPDDRTRMVQNQFEKIYKEFFH